MGKELMSKAKRIVVIALCLALLFSDSSRIGVRANLNEQGETIENSFSLETTYNKMNIQVTGDDGSFMSENGEYELIAQSAEEYMSLLEQIQEAERLQIENPEMIRLYIHEVLDDSQAGNNEETETEGETESVEETESLEETTVADESQEEETFESEETEVTDESEQEPIVEPVIPGDDHGNDEEQSIESEGINEYTPTTLSLENDVEENYEEAEESVSEEVTVTVDDEAGNEADEIIHSEIVQLSEIGLVETVADESEETEETEESTEIIEEESEETEETNNETQEEIEETNEESQGEVVLEKKLTEVGNLIVTISGLDTTKNYLVYSISENGNFQKMPVSLMAGEGRFSFSTAFLGVFMLAEAEYAYPMTDYIEEENLDGSVVSFNATMFNYSREPINNYTKSLGDTRNFLEFNSGHGTEIFNRNNADRTGESPDSALQGLIMNELDPTTGEPVFNLNAARLFSTEPEYKTILWPDNKGNMGYAKKTYEDVSFPFYYDNGMYVFDSDTMSLKANDEFYEKDELNAYTLYHNTVKGTTGAAYLGMWGLEGFWPFSTQWNTKDVHFGMKLDIGFTMNAEGDVNGRPAVYTFSGDDDVWVFIDNKLVLDLGGIHGRVTGTIDFKNNAVAVSYAKQLKQRNGYFSATAGGNVGFALSDVLGEDYFNDATKEHKLTVFYLERGSYESRCYMSFSLEAIETEKTEETPNVRVDKKATVSNWDDRTYDISIGVSSETEITKFVDDVLTEVVKAYETKNVTIKDVIDDRFYIDDDSIAELVADGAIVTVPSEDNPYYIVTWENQTVAYVEDPEAFGWEKTIHITAKDAYFGGNDVYTNVNPGSCVTFLSSAGEPVVKELPQPKVNVKVESEISSAFDVIFEGDRIAEYLSEDDLPQFIQIDANGNIIAVGEYSDLRDVTVLPGYFYEIVSDENGGQTETIITLEELKAEAPKSDRNYFYKVLVELKSDGLDEVTKTAMEYTENGVTKVYTNDLSVESVATYDIYVFHGEITVTKEIKVEDIDFSEGDPIFTFALNGNQETYFKTVRFTQRMIEQLSNEQETVTLSVTFENLHKGTYVLTELATIRYELDEFVDVAAEFTELENTTNFGHLVMTAENKVSSAEFTFIVPQYEKEEDVISENDPKRMLKGYATAKNEKVLDYYDSDTDVVINTFVIINGELVSIDQNYLNGNVTSFTR